MLHVTAHQNYKKSCSNCCYVDNENITANNVIQIQIDDVNIVMKVKRDDTVLSEDIILPEWVFSSFQINHGIICSLKKITDIIQTDTITLCFSSFRNLKQWDEGSHNNLSFEQSFCWSEHWPDSVDVEILESMCPMLLCGDYMGDSSTISVKVMDLTMLFKVQIHSEKCDDSQLSETKKTCQASLNTVYKILRGTLYSPLNVVSPDALEAVITKSLSSSSTTATKIRLHSELLFAQNDFDEKTSSIPALVRSILLCGAEGAGKSYLLHGLANDLRCGATNKNLSNPCVTVHASAMNVNKAAVEKALKSVHNFRVNKESQVPATVQFAHVYLSVLLELLEVESSVRHNATSALQQGQCLFLVVDDLDLIMAQYGAVGDSAAVGGGDESSAYEGPAVVSPGNEMQIVGYILSKLLKLVAPSHTSNERSSRVMVVGACRLDVKAVPRAHTGCPEFELLVLLPRMSAQDRAIAVLDMISEHLRLQPTNLERLSDVSVINVETIVGQSDGETNVARWACRIAVITAGYLPGDLVALIRYTFLIHRGRMEAEALSVSQGSGILLWDTLLQALLSLPPKQLQSLGIDSSSGGGGPQQQTRLCWADFAGYAHEVRQIKRLFANPRREDSEKHGGAPSLLGLFSCPKGIVLHGPTGCGKSMLARVIAAEANMNFVAIRSTEILSQYFGETEASVRGLFARARAASPCVLFFDEFDAIAHKRGGGDDSSAGLHGRILSTFLNELDGVAGGGGGGFESSVLVLVASNDLSTLDEALLRPGRLQHHVLLGKPSLEDVRAIVARQMLRMPCANEGDGEAIDLSSLCSRLMFVSPSCADAEALCHKALAAAIREQILASQAVTGGALSARRVVCQRHFEAALQELVGWRESLPSESDVKLESTPPFVFENRGEFHF